jgi:hypothetical protein
MAALALLTFIHAARESRRRNDLLPIFLVIGAGLSVFYEPLGDHLVHVYYPEKNQLTWITNYGLDIPVFIGLLYFWYMPFAAFVMLRKRRTGFTVERFWTEWTAKTVFFVGFEIVVLALCGTTWIYYDPQPFKVANVPLLTPVTYAAFALAIGVVACMIERFVPKRLYWVAVPLVPATMMTSHVLASMPLSSTLWTTTNTTVLTAGAVMSGILSVGFAALVCWWVRQPWFIEDPEPNVLPAVPARR